MTDIFEIENTNLEAHVSICAERYKQLDTRLNNLEKRFDTFETNLKEIKDMVSRERSVLDNKFLIWAGMLITGLTGTLGFLISHYIIK